MQEDAKLVQLVTRYGIKVWNFISKHLSGRSAYSCRERWIDHANPAIDRSRWRREEDDIILEVRVN